MKNKALTELRRYAVMTLGCLIYAVSIAIFLDPKGLAPGGVTGIAIMVSYATKIPTGTLVLLINIPLLAIGVWKFGKQFLYCTVFSTVLSSLMINGLSGVVVPTDDQLLIMKAPGSTSLTMVRAFGKSCFRMAQSMTSFSLLEYAPIPLR